MSGIIPETVTDIARRRGVTAYAVERALIKTRIQPANRFGTTRVFDIDGVKALDAELDRVAAVKAAREQRKAERENGGSPPAPQA